MKVCIIASRFGEEIIGGAERLILDIIEILPSHWEIHVHTTCAKDYITWKNEYKPGTYKQKHYYIHRYPTDFPRKLKSFNKFTKQLKEKFPNQTLDDEWDWLIQQGPYSSKLNQIIKKSLNDYDLNIFISYLYLPTVLGIKNSNKKTILIPTLHDEFPAYLQIFKSIFHDNLHYFFNAPEELKLFQKIYGFQPKNYLILGTYIKIPTKHTIVNQEPYFLNIGRMDAGKGYLELIEFFSRWKAKFQSPFDLYIIGSNPPNLKNLNGIHFLGYVTEDEKNDYLARCQALINPSRLESFSLVIMEAWSHAKPILVSAYSEVMVGHCKRSNGGLYYKDYESFEMVMNIMSKEKGFMSRLGLNGREYVRKNFSKEVIQMKLLNYLKTI